MDTNRSQDHEDASYSEDFEQDVESHDSPVSEEKVEIKVFKSPVGSLTVQPKKITKTGLHPKTTARTLSELSLFTKKKPPFDRTQHENQLGSNNISARSASVKITESRTSLVRQGTHNIRRKPLAQVKIGPHDVPASASISSASMSRLSAQRPYSGYSMGNTTNNIRRVAAHTSIKEKSYASAKFKTYHNPPLRGGVSNPPLRAGVAKPTSNIAQRISSAKRMTIMDLKSKIKLLQDEIEKLKKENRFLNHLHHRQDNALKKWEGKDAELPRLLNQHKDEIRSLQEQLRKAHHHAREYNEKLSVRDKKILRLQTELDKLRTLVHEEHLQDRHTLQQELDITQMNLAGAEKRIREYMRHVDILEKNHKHQLVAQDRKLIKVNTHTYELQQVVANLKLALRNKDRMLNYIQMRSSGRSLIRAFHAERGGADEMVYGASISPDLNRPYQPPSILKSHSFDFGNSRCATPFPEEKRDFDFRHGKHRSDDFHLSYNENQKGDISPTRPLSRLSNSLESILAPRRVSSSRQPKVEKDVKKSRSVVPSHEVRPSSKSDSTKISMNKDKPNAVKSILKTSHNKVEDHFHNNEALSEKRNQRGHKDKTVQKKQPTPREGDTDKPDMLKRQETKDDSSFVKQIEPEANESKEFIYRGSTTGFKYEGPFVTSNSNLNQESTEILYSPQTDKTSEQSITSSETTSSSRSEIMSNIDILSARIRASCVLVPPPEQNLNGQSHPNDSTRSLAANGRNMCKSFVDLKTNPVGPGGDNNNNTPRLAPIMIANTGNVMSSQEELQQASSSFQAGVLQSIPLYATDSHDTNSPKSQQSFIASSPRMQINSISLSGVTATQQNASSNQFQLSQPQAASISYIQANTTNKCSALDSSVMQQSHLTAEDTCTQLLETASIQYSPRQSYPTFNTVSVLNTEPMHHQQLPSCQTRLPYFSFSQDIQMPQPTSVTIIQTNPVYDQTLTAPTGNTPITHHPAQAPFFTPARTSSFPPVGCFNPQAGSDHDQAFLNTNSNKANNKNNQSGYNPSYYVNLGSWK